MTGTAAGEDGYFARGVGFGVDYFLGGDECKVWVRVNESLEGADDEAIVFVEEVFCRHCDDYLNEWIGVLWWIDGELGS